jgi:hypothetical protein
MLFDFLSKLADINTQILRIFSVRRAPHRGENLLVSHHTSGVFRQERQQLKFFWRELEFCAALDRTVAQGVHFEVADSQNGYFRLALHAVPQRCPHARQQFTDIERFVDVIVSTEVKGFDLFGLALTRRQHNNGKVGLFSRSPYHVFSIAIG